MERMAQTVARRIGIIAGGGTLPFALAQSVQTKGDVPVLLPLIGYCDPAAVTAWRHHWINLGRLGRLLELLRKEECRELVCVGSLIRPSLSEIRLDWQTLRAMPALIAAYRGGDNHLLTGIGRIIEKHGVKFVGVADVAADLTVPEGAIARAKPDARAEADIAIARAVLSATAAFDIGQAAVVIDGHVVALEDIGGTDLLLTRIARLREERKLRAPLGHGVLVKMPKTGQDLRFDMPAVGPRTIEGVSKAGLGGIAVVAARTLLAEPEAVVEAADRAGLFVVGLPA